MKRKTVIYEIPDEFEFPEDKRRYEKCKGCPCIAETDADFWCGLYDTEWDSDEKGCPFHDFDNVTIEVDARFFKKWKR